MSTIVITEKPSVAQEYKKVLGVQSTSRTDGYIEGYSSLLNTNVIITWAVGHLVTICSPEEQNPAWKGWSAEILPMIPENYKYKPINDTKKQFEIVKGLYNRSDIDTIYYAGDSGREGIYIQALIRNLIFGRTPSEIDEKVVWIDSFTESEIKRGIQQAKPYSEYSHMIESGYARAITDWLIGMNFTVAFSVSVNAKVNTGRVMTPTLAMVVNRQKQIDNFKKTNYYGVKAVITNGSEALWEVVKDSRFYGNPDLYNESGFLHIENTKALIAEFNRDMRLFIQDVKVKKVSELAPLFFNQTDLQAYCSKSFKISPTETLAAAQRLYEAKLTTYPRTSARVISTAVAKDYKQRFGFDIPKKYIDDKKIVDHYAIIPTFEGDASSLSGIDKSVYDAIMKRFMDSMKPAYEYNSVTVTYRHANKEYLFERFSNVLQAGWKDIPNDKMVQRPVPEKNTVVNVKAFELRSMETSPPVPYTTGTLVEDMEKAGKYVDDEELRAQIRLCGLGTDATRANIVQKLIDCKYIEVDKKQKVTPTDFGKAVIALITPFDEQLVSPIKTADLESNLSAIVDNEMNYTDFIKKVEEYVSTTTSKIVTAKNKAIESAGPLPGASEIIGKCPKCGANVSEGKFGYYCTGKCGAIINKVYGKELTKTQIVSLLNGKEISYTHNGRKTNVYPKMVENNYNGKQYFIWDTHGDNPPATTVPEDKAPHDCPICQKLLKKNSYGGWNCDCGFSVRNEICGTKITETILDQLIKNGETEVMSFFSAKKNKNFDAKLVVDKDTKKVTFAF